MNRKLSVLFTIAVILAVLAIPLVASAEEYHFSSSFGSMGSGDGQFEHSDGLCSDASGNIYVADTYNYRVQKFTADGTFITKWGTQGVGDGQFGAPCGICTDSAGYVYVTDCNNRRVQKFTPDGMFITKWNAVVTNGNGTPVGPYGICIDPAGNVYVTYYDFRSFTAIQKFAPNGSLLSTWDTASRYTKLEAICYGNDGLIYTSGSGAYGSIVTKYTPDGVIVSQWPVAVNCSPHRMCIDSQNKVYVGGFYSHIVCKYTADGELITSWGNTKPAYPYDVGYFNSFGLCTDGADGILVLDYANYCIKKFRPSTGIDIAKQVPDGTPVKIYGAIATSSPAILGDSCFTIEEHDRAIGIRVVGPGVMAGYRADIVGHAETIDGERVIVATSTTMRGNQVAFSVFPTPMDTTIQGIGGGEMGMQGAVVNDAPSGKMSSGVNSVGLLVRIRGRVTAANDTGDMTGYFYVDDSYGVDSLKDGSGNVGMKCSPKCYGTLAPIIPAVGSYIEVVGTVGVTQINGVNARFFRTIGISEAQFDEFTSPVLEGWNLMSMPAQPRDADPTTVFGSANLIDGNLQKWDGATQGLATYDSWGPEAFGGISNTQGYWLVANAPRTIDWYVGYKAIVPTPTYAMTTTCDVRIPVFEGANLIGVPFTHNTYWADWKVTDGTTTKTMADARDAGWLNTMLYSWDAENQGMFDVGLPDEWPSCEQLNAWQGYWVTANKDLALIAPAASVAP